MRIACAAALLALVGCTNPAPPPTSALIPCTDPRPQVCTMEYAPACGELAAGGQREYASGCNACAASEVTGYRMGPCPE
jgi:hypothetical protein